MSSLSKFFIQFSQFFTTSALSLLFGLITFPIFTRILTKEQYGILGLVSITILLLVAIAKAGLSHGIIRFYQEYSGNQEKRTIFSSTVVIRGVLISAITVLLYLALFPVVSHQLGIDDKFLVCFTIMAICLFIRPLNFIVRNLLRVNDKTVFMNAVALIGRIISVALSLFLLIYIFHELFGYFIGVAIAEVIVSVILFSWFFSNYKISIKKVSHDLSVKLIKFGTPLLFTELFYLLLSYADRYMIIAYLGQSALGVYSVGYNLAMYISDMITFPIFLAIGPIIVKIYGKEGKEKTEEFLQRCTHYLLIAIIPICFGYYAISKELFISLASEKYATAADFSPFILIGTILLGMNHVFNAGLYLKKKSMKILSIMLIAVVINICMNLILLPQYGIMGAAIATLVSCVAAVILTVCLSFKYIVVRINIKTVIYYLMLSCLMFLVVKQIETSEVWMNLITKFIVGVLIVVPGVLLREKQILAKIKAINQLKKV